MFQRLCTYFQDTGVLVFGGYVLSGHCNQQQISVKTEGYLLSEGYLFTGFYGIVNFLPSCYLYRKPETHKYSVERYAYKAETCVDFPMILVFDKKKLC